MVMAMISKQEHADDINHKTHETNNDDQARVVDSFRVDKTRDGVDSDGKAKCEQEYSVCERAKQLGALESVSECRRGRALRHAQRYCCSGQCQHIGQHVEAVRQQRQRAGRHANDQFDDKVQASHDQHRAQPMRSR
jgi:hypothetical protein